MRKRVKATLKNTIEGILNYIGDWVSDVDYWPTPFREVFTAIIFLSFAVVVMAIGFGLFIVIGFAIGFMLSILEVRFVTLGMADGFLKSPHGFLDYSLYGLENSSVAFFVLMILFWLGRFFAGEKPR